MNEKKIKVTITGVSPLLMNKPSLLEISDKAKTRQAGKNVLEEQFNDKQYVTDEGKLFIPETHIKGCLLEAGKNVKVTGKGKSTYSKIIGYAVIIEPAQILHKKTKLTKFTVLAVNPNTKGRNPLCRPMLKEWEADFTITFDSDEMPIEALKECLDIGGKRVGIGDWRPQKKGVYGRFMITEFKQQKDN